MFERCYFGQNCCAHSYSNYMQGMAGFQVETGEGALPLSLKRERKSSKFCRGIDRAACHQSDVMRRLNV